MSMMSSAKRRWFKNFPFMFIPISFQSNFLKTLSRLVVNNLGEMVSPCLTPLSILNLSVFLCSFTHFYIHIEWFWCISNRLYGIKCLFIVKMVVYCIIKLEPDIVLL